MWGFKRSFVEAFVWSLWMCSCCDLWSLPWYIAVVVAVTTVVLGLATYRHEYWRSRGVFSPPALPVVGHIWSVVTFREQGGMCFKRIYDKYKDLEILGTLQFFQRTLVVRSPALVRRICVTDFAHFTDRGFFFNRWVDPLAGSVLFLTGVEWRNLRAKITPIFSPNKLKGMLPLIENTADEFVIRIKRLLTVNQSVSKNNKTRNITELFDDIEFDSRHGTINSATVKSEKLFGGYTADAIVPCAFGLKSNVMDNERDPFAVALQAFYETSIYNTFEKTMRQFWPAFVLFFRMRIIPRKTHDFFYNIVTNVLRAREKGLQEKRGDFIDMMMALRNDEKNNNANDKQRDEGDVEITDMVIAANAFIIFLGGFETTSATLAFLFMELAAHPEIQKKLRAEVLQVLEKHNGQITYEMLQDLVYMEMVIQETLRLYPPFPNIQRLCTKDYRIPESDVTVEKGTIVLFPTLGIQRDPQYWERAEQFVPERWEGAAPAPGLYMPFGDGPRYCIGKRFAMIQMKICLVKTLPIVRISPPPAAPLRTEPFRADPKSPLTLHPADSTLTFNYIPPEKLSMFC